MKIFLAVSLILNFLAVGEICFAGLKAGFTKETPHPESLDPGMTHRGAVARVQCVVEATIWCQNDKLDSALLSIALPDPVRFDFILSEWVPCSVDSARPPKNPSLDANSAPSDEFVFSVPAHPSEKPPVWHMLRKPKYANGHAQI